VLKAKREHKETQENKEKKVQQEHKETKDKKER
jgi:hypothetical protein